MSVVFFRFFRKTGMKGEQVDLEIPLMTAIFLITNGYCS
jgi:hypothetical protein